LVQRGLEEKTCAPVFRRRNQGDVFAVNAREEDCYEKEGKDSFHDGSMGDVRRRRVWLHSGAVMGACSFV
ncbi:MAG: hypothetical protein QF662_02135, partial [Phycisphaerae bacterium]|nr:hypothetical protein [Phycisphaerae bacterium]